MTTTLKSFLNRQTFLLVGIAYAVSIAILVVMSVTQAYRSQDDALAGLLATAGSQVNTLLPSFLLPEERSGQEMILNKFRAEEGLSEIEIAADADPSDLLGWSSSCQRHGDQTLCRSLFPSRVMTLTPVTDGQQHFGALIKVKLVESGVLAINFIPTAAILAIALLLSLFGLIRIGMRLTSREIPHATELLLSEVRQSLAGEQRGPISTFRFEEFHQLSIAIQELIRTAQDGRRMAAIAQTTQMLAHDVRKPFSILRMGLNMLGAAKDTETIKKVLERMVPEINKALSNVDGLIADVMEVGSTSTTLIQEPTHPESLIESAIGEFARVYPKAKVIFSYDLAHQSGVHVHESKIGRVFSNILSNAVQAMKFERKIWFRTRETGDGFIEFCVGNSGSVIPKEDLPKVFDAFFTSGRKRGTGLGLAIAQKVVAAHGGKIWCESSVTPDHPQGKVEFLFTLPMAKESIPAFAGRLPANLEEISKGLAVPVTHEDHPTLVSKSQLILS